MDLDDIPKLEGDAESIVADWLSDPLATPPQEPTPLRPDEPSRVERFAELKGKSVQDEDGINGIIVRVLKLTRKPWEYELCWFEEGGDAFNFIVADDEGEERLKEMMDRHAAWVKTSDAYFGEGL